MSRPRITAIVPGYNHAVYLPARLDSVYGQRGVEFEVLLLDDASTDNSLDVLRRYADRPHTRLITNATNSGSPFAQWNRGVELAQGEFIWLAESDDLAAPDLLQRLTEMLIQHPQAALAYCQSIKIDAHNQAGGPIENDLFRGTPAAHRWEQDFCNSGDDEIANYLYFQNTIPSASAVVFRRDRYLAVGGADPSYRISGDWLHWIRMLAGQQLCYTAMPLSQSRFHPQSQRFSTACNGQRELESLRVQAATRALVDINPAAIRTAAQQQMTTWLQQLRAGRYSGERLDHLRFARLLRQANAATAAKFALHLPRALATWQAKRWLSPAAK
ncbi:glycosyltransferase [Roseimaritima ulvae]|uniref:PGL/p-HBAD biosynthesis glycosyltransferase n=1 Tax=Roseimaritima ulvae TaxID=980254 RepID=A0A5B9QYE9_9BACT|nr:glycosyltransferase [Roseimaritima ulvae]QEG43052.1 PGL/p-HBAD biosynthesis glycosyltransferase [Roseimaritima ulvae]